MADIDQLNKKLDLILKHLEHIETHLNIPPPVIEKSAPKRTGHVMTADMVKPL